MPQARLAFCVLLVVVIASGARAGGRKLLGSFHDREARSGDPRVGRPVPPGAIQPAHLAGSSLAALGEAVLVIDPDSGQLVQADPAGKPVASLFIGRDAAQ